MTTAITNLSGSDTDIKAFTDAIDNFDKVITDLTANEKKALTDVLTTSGANNEYTKYTAAKEAIYSSNRADYTDKATEIDAVATAAGDLATKAQDADGTTKVDGVALTNDEVTDIKKLTAALATAIADAGNATNGIQSKEWWKADTQLKAGIRHSVKPSGNVPHIKCFAMFKKTFMIFLFCFLAAGCGKTKEQTGDRLTSEQKAVVEQAERQIKELDQKRQEAEKNATPTPEIYVEKSHFQPEKEVYDDNIRSIKTIGLKEYKKLSTKEHTDRAAKGKNILFSLWKYGTEVSRMYSSIRTICQPMQMGKKSKKFSFIRNRRI